MKKQNETLKQQIEEVKKQNSILGQQLDELRKRPKLKVEFDYYFLDKDLQKQLSPFMGYEFFENVKILRIKVSNIGLDTARECIVKARILRNDTWDYFGGIKLRWVRNPYSDSNIEETYKPINIAVNDFEIAELIRIIKDVQTNILSKESTDKYITEESTIITGDIGIRRPFPIGSSYSIKLSEGNIIMIIVYCNNCTSDPVCLRVKKVPTYDTINSSNIKDYFDEIECPKL